MSPNFLLIFLCLVIGGVLRVSGKFPKTAPQAFNAFVIWVSLPALVLLQIPALLRTVQIDSSLLVPVSMAWLLFLLSYLFFWSVGKLLHWPRTEVGALILTAGLGNTSFVGLPLLDSFFGDEGVRIGVLVDQPGTFLVLSTFGLIVASMYSPKVGRKVTASAIVKNILKFPPFIALIVAILWHFSGTDSESVITKVLERLASTLVPLALIAVGFQLRVSPALLRRQWKPLALGLTFKLFLGPLFFYFLYVVVFAQQGLVTRVAILEAAMAPMITASVVADEFGLNTEIANLMVGIGIPLSLLTVWLWNHFMPMM